MFCASLSNTPRQTRYRMTEEEARQCHGDNAVNVEGSLELRKRISGSFRPLRD